MPITVGSGWSIGSGWSLADDTLVGTTPTLVSGATVVAQSPYAAGGTAYSFNGTNNYVTYAGATQTAFGTGDFTVEMFVNYASVTGRRDSVWWGASASDRGGILKNLSTTNLTYYISPTVAAAVNYAWTPTLSTWYHIALVRISNSTKLYVNGTAQGTPSPYTDTKNYTGTGYTVTVGKDNGSSAGYFSGYMTSLRVTKGVGVYTGNFTVPTTQLNYTQSAGTNISAITADQCTILMVP